MASIQTLPSQSLTPHQGSRVRVISMWPFLCLGYAQVLPMDHSQVFFMGITQQITPIHQTWVEAAWRRTAALAIYDTRPGETGWAMAMACDQGNPFVLCGFRQGMLGCREKNPFVLCGVRQGMLGCREGNPRMLRGVRKGMLDYREENLLILCGVRQRMLDPGEGNNKMAMETLHKNYPATSPRHGKIRDPNACRYRQIHVTIPEGCRILFPYTHHCYHHSLQGRHSQRCPSRPFRRLRIHS